MKHVNYLLLLLLIGLIGWQCSEFQYDNPLDPEGINKSVFIQDPNGEDPNGWNGDDNNNGIINLLDPTYNQDTSAPVIQFLMDIPVSVRNSDQAQLDSILELWDAVDNEPFIKNDPTGVVNIYKDSCYIKQFSATDSLGNTGYASLEICVVTPPKKDTIPPILTIHDTIITIILNSSYTPPTFSAFDNMDMNITKNVTTDKEVDSSVAGEQFITYSVSDKAGNTTSKTIKVIVKAPGPGIDIVPPVIPLLGEDTIFLSEDDDFEAYKASYVDAGAEAEDGVDGIITDKIVVSDFIEINRKYSYISFNVKDSSGNQAQEVRRYFDTGIKPPSPPIIELDANDTDLDGDALAVLENIPAVLVDHPAHVDLPRPHLTQAAQQQADQNGHGNIMIALEEPAEDLGEGDQANCGAEGDQGQGEEIALVDSTQYALVFA